MKIKKKIAGFLSLVFTALIVSTSGVINVKAATNESGTKNSTVTATGTPGNDSSIDNGIEKSYRDLKYRVENNQITITDCNNSAVSVEIPSEINGIKVTSIGEDAFRYCDSLISIEIPSSVTSIGESAFYCCESLTNIEIPDSVTSIGNGAFDSCSRLSRIKLPNSLTNIGDYLFQACESLSSIEIPNSVNTIGKSAFVSCSSLTSIKIPNGVTSIGEYAFIYSNRLSSIEIPSSVTHISGSAFYHCTSLSKIIVDESNTKYSSEGGVLYSKDKKVLVSCQMAQDKDIEKIFSRVERIGDYAFTYATLPSRLIIPDNISAIGSNAFLGCDTLSSIEIPSSVTSIGDHAFWGCFSLNSIVIPDSVRNIGEGVFENCNDNLAIHGYSGSVAESYAKNNSIKFIAGIPVSSIAFDNSKLTMKVGDTKKLSVVYTPTNAELGKEYTLSSSNEMVAKVDKNGQVVAIGIGTATITAKTLKGLTTTCVVTVNNKLLSLGNISIDKASPQVIGTAIQLSASAEGKGVIQYKFIAVKDGKILFLVDYNKANTATWTPTEAGTYTLYFKAKDETGKEVIKATNYVVNDIIPKITKITTDLTSPQAPGKAIKLSTSVEKQGDFQYAFIVMKGGKTTFVRSYNTLDTATWMPTETGTYTIHFKVKNANGIVVDKTMTYVVKDKFELIITSIKTNLISPQVKEMLKYVFGAIKIELER